tara:strand:+ start:4860 stop:5804 length:945 start_codon:yes stop_codon:yes gene_type:complete
MQNEKLKNLALRDAFIYSLQKIGEKDKKVILLTNDQGAPALDDYRKNLPKQFFNAGISEQNIVATAAGLSLAGFKPYIYSISSFIIYRTIEYIKIDMCGMKQPVKIFGVGSGYSYPEDGLTHHSTEDIALTKALPNLDIFNPSDPLLTKDIVNYVYKSKNPSFIRLDRKFCDTIFLKKNNINDGFRVIKKSKRKEKYCIISSGFFVPKLNKLFNNQNIDFDFIDFYRLKKFDKKKFQNTLKKYKKIISIEEHSREFGIGTIISEIITDNFLTTKLLRLGLLENSTFGYGNREQLLKKNGLNNNNIIIKMKKFFI